MTLNVPHYNGSGICCNAHAVNERSPGLENVTCIADSVAASWTGETIADFPKKVIAVTGRPAAYINVCNNLKNDQTYMDYCCLIV
jgi:hypothetical protein